MLLCKPTPTAHFWLLQSLSDVPHAEAPSAPKGYLEPSTPDAVSVDLRLCVKMAYRDVFCFKDEYTSVRGSNDLPLLKDAKLALAEASNPLAVLHSLS